jgi:GTP cyclohydrolase I
MGILTVEEAALTLLEAAEGGSPLREGLQETPVRFAKAWQFWTAGYAVDPADVLKQFEDGADGYDEIVLVRDIPIYSLCEHHLAPFWGKAHIAYLPNQRIVGLSKLARLCEIFARRLQVQERLTKEIASALRTHLKPVGTAVILECRHMCMESRGVRAPGTITTTSAMYDSFRKDSKLRMELMSLLQLRTTP